MLMLHPYTVIVYDELEASEAVRWEWLLHSPTEFKIDATKKTLSTNNKTKGLVAVTQLFGGHVFTLSQTDRFVVPPAITGAEYGDIFNVGGWTIKAVLDASKAPELTVSHHTEQAVFSYGTDNPALNGYFYSRQYMGSSLLYDEIDGAYQVVEMTDRSPISTRVVNQ